MLMIQHYRVRWIKTRFIGFKSEKNYIFSEVNSTKKEGALISISQHLLKLKKK